MSRFQNLANSQFNSVGQRSSSEQPTQPVIPGFDMESLMQQCRQKKEERDQYLHMNDTTFGKIRSESEIPLGLKLLAQVNDDEMDELRHVEELDKRQI